MFAISAMSRRLSIALALLCLVWIGPRSEAASQVIDRILLVVNAQPITQSRLELFRAYLRATGGDGLGWPRPVSDLDRLSSEDLLNILVVDELLFEGGSRVEALRVREKAIVARIEQFRTGFPSPERYQAFVDQHELDADALREFFIRRLRVEGYIELKLGTERPSERELRAYYEANQDTFGDRSFEEIREHLAATLYAARAAGRFEQWVAELRSRANIQVPARAQGTDAHTGDAAGSGKPAG